MKAMVLREYKRLELEDRPAPEVGAGEVLVAVAACGICGSDVHGFDGSTGRRIPPLVMGHEAAGTVAAVGAGVTRFKAGDRITFDSTIYCGECFYCKRGDVNLCDRREIVGVSCGEFRRDGAFAEYVAVPERIVYPLPETMPMEEAALLEAVSVALHAVRMSEAREGDTALVVGAGMIGLLTMQAALAAGCSRVFVTDIVAPRLDLAKELGATETIAGAGEAIRSECMRLTGGTGVDVAFEAVGGTETIAAAIDATRKGGTITLIGNVTANVNLPLQKVVSRQLRLQGTQSSAGEYPEAIRLVSEGGIRVRPMISAVAPLDEGPRWFERLYAHEPGLMKIVLAPSAEAAK
jgi:L-iditol 2-dehydrogenase